MGVQKKFRAGLAQIPVKLGERAENQETVKRWMKQYCIPSDVITAVSLPELWDVGYALDSVPKYADGEGSGAAGFLGGLAREYNCWFTGGSVMVSAGGKYYNRSLVINPAGELVTFYDKVHLVPFITVEDGVFEHGEKICTYDMDGIVAGNIICYDIRFPEWIRIYALHGVETLFICSQWTLARMDLFTTMIRAHAIENMFYTVAVNTCGESGGIDFGGGSFVSSPAGEVMGSCGGAPGGMFIDIDATNIDENRKFLKVFEKRLPHLYGDLIPR